MAFPAEHEGLLAVDEIPLDRGQVVRAITQLVDADTALGRFLLT